MADIVLEGIFQKLLEGVCPNLNPKFIERFSMELNLASQKAVFK